MFFFVNTNLLIRGLELGEYVVATNSCDMLNTEFDLDTKIEQFMVGEVVGIIDETIYQITVRVYPNKQFIYTEDCFFLTPFVLLEDVREEMSFPTQPKINSVLKKFLRQILEKSYLKLKNSKRFKQIRDFLNSDSLT